MFRRRTLALRFTFPIWPPERRRICSPIGDLCAERRAPSAETENRSEAEDVRDNLQSQDNGNSGAMLRAELGCIGSMLCRFRNPNLIQRVSVRERKLEGAGTRAGASAASDAFECGLEPDVVASKQPLAAGFN